MKATFLYVLVVSLFIAEKNPAWGPYFNRFRNKQEF